MGSTEGNKNAAFWLRDDIEGARRALDVWASCLHHRRSGCDGVPTTPWLDERDSFIRRLVKVELEKDVRKLAHVSGRVARYEMFTGTEKQFWKLVEGGKIVKEEVSLPSTRPQSSSISPVMALALAVGSVLAEMGNPPLLTELLLHRYPRVGPYTRDNDSYRRFRPGELLEGLVGHLRGKHVERKIDQLLGQLEREFLCALSERGVARRDGVTKTKKIAEENSQVQEPGSSAETSEGYDNNSELVSS